MKTQLVDYKSIQYQIEIISILRQKVRKITNEMLGVRGLTETISHNPYRISIFLASTTSSLKKNSKKWNR